MSAADKPPRTDQTVADALDSTLDTPGPARAPGARAPDGGATPDGARYEVAEEIARGGLGRILRAWDRRLRRPVAIKELLADHQATEERFHREALVTAHLEHPAIVPVHDAGRWSSGAPFYAMKLVNGRSLADVMKGLTTLRERLALLPHIIAVADAIAYAHSQGVIHRDLKPHNVLVGEFGETVVIDWGLAKELARADPPGAAPDTGQARIPSDQLTMDGAVMGTPAYMPPEQADSRTVDARADVYSLGAILYHLLAGAAPYQSEAGARDVLKQLLIQPPPPLVLREPDAPRDLVAIVDKAMARDPDGRYPSARELAEDLKRFQTGKIVGAYHYSAREILGRWLRRHRTTVAVAGVMLAILIVAGALGLREIVARGRRAEAERVRAVTRGAEARHSEANALAEGARAALVHDAPIEARAKLRGSLEAEDSLLARALWLSLTREPLRWKKDVGAAVYNVAFSPDGRTVAAACQDRSVYLFDLDTVAVRVLRGQGDQVTSLAWAPDGRTLASGSWSGQIGMWDVAAGTVRLLPGHTAAVWALTFSPDGRWLISGSIDKTIRLWDVAGATTIRTLTGHAAEVSHVAVSPDGTQLLSTSSDKTARLWDFPSGAPRAVLAGHELAAASGEFSPDGKLIATASWDRKVRLWDRATGALLATLVGHTDQVQAVHFSPDGLRLASAGADRLIIVWDVATRGQTLQLQTRSDRIHDLEFSPDGRYLVTGGNDNTVGVWDLTRGPGEGTAHGHSLPIVGVAFSPDSQRVATASYDMTVRLWDVRSGRQTLVIGGHTQRIYDVVFTPDGRHLASGSGDGSIRLWDASSGALEHRYEHGAAVYDVAISPDGTRLVSVGTDALGKVWDLDSGTLLHTLHGHEDRIYDVTWSPDGQTIATGSYDTNVRLWRAADGTPVRVLAGHSDAVDGLAFTPDSQRLVSGSEDHTVRVWDVRTGKSRVLGTHPGRVYRLSLSPDGRRVGASGSDGTARLWDMDTGAVVVLTGHRGEVDDVAFTPDGRFVASASDDGTVRLWDATTGHVAWRAPALLAATLELYTHEGWIAMGPTPRVRQSEWRSAIETRARAASEHGDVLCLRTDDDGLELWHTTTDRRTLAVPVPGIATMLATPHGCLVLAGRQARLYSDAGPTVLSADAAAIAWDHGDILIAVDRDVLALDEAGLTRARYQGALGVTAMRRVAGLLVLGFENGNIELSPSNTARERPAFAFADIPSTPVVGLLEGPLGTLIVGYANGLVGMWNLDNGEQLLQTRLHGPIAHLTRVGDTLYVATELGDRTTIDLAVFQTDWCGLLRTVWHEVPVVWEGGLPVRRGPPGDHPCAE